MSAPPLPPGPVVLNPAELHRTPAPLSVLHTSAVHLLSRAAVVLQELRLPSENSHHQSCSSSMHRRRVAMVSTSCASSLQRRLAAPSRAQAPPLPWPSSSCVCSDDVLLQLLFLRAASLAEPRGVALLWQLAPLHG
ncbi:hypothetical protein VPH35_065822 [Triticum aestivum]